jgi:hypothetical protein
LERWDGVVWTGLVWLRIGTGGDSFEFGKAERMTFGWRMNEALNRKSKFDRSKIHLVFVFGNVHPEYTHLRLSVLYKKNTTVFCS